MSSKASILKTFTGVCLLYDAGLVSAVQQDESAVYKHMSLFVGFPSGLGHHRAWRRVPCAIGSSH